MTRLLWHGRALHRQLTVVTVVAWIIGLAAAVSPAARVFGAQKSAVVPATGDGPAEQVAFINERIRQGWAEYELSPSRQASDGEWCRRLFLDVLGRIPSIDELNEFRSRRLGRKRAELVETLLTDERYTDQYARHWTTIWTNLLIGRDGGGRRRSVTNRAGMQAYLRRSLTENKPYDRMVYELVSATGGNTPGMPRFNGAVNFLIGKLGDKAVQATVKTAQIFLGLQLQCTQCHNHPFNRWDQGKFWQTNAFFRQTAALRRFEPGTRNLRFVELANQDFAGEGNPPTPDSAEIYYELRNRQAKVAYPEFIDGTAIPRSGYVSDVDRRSELAKRIVQSETMRKAIVNRMWAHFLGYGFTKPIDDMGPHNRPTHPRLLEHLGDKFRDGGFDLKQLVRWIVLSRPYALSSRTTSRNARDDPSLGEGPKFSRFYLRQMRAEALYESLLVATEAQNTRDDDAQRETTKQTWLRQFVVAFGTDEDDAATTFNGTIPQSLVMLNGELIENATNGRSGSFLHNVANGRMRWKKQIEHLFLAALARKPTRRETRMASKLLSAQKGDHATALQDVWWVLLNSNEFILNH